MEITRLRRPEGGHSGIGVSVGVFLLAGGNPTSQTFTESLYLHFYCCFLDINPLLTLNIHSFFLESLFQFPPL